MTEIEIVPTRNGYGWTSTVPNQITLALVEWLLTLDQAHPLVLDIGAGLGVGTFPILDAGATAIALDLDGSHLDSIRHEAERRSAADRLTTVAGRFPGPLQFQGLDAIHCSNVLHFLRGSEIETGAAAMYQWLKPGGKVFLQVGTIYAGHITRLLPIFDERRKLGVKWARETDQAREYVAAEFGEATPSFMNYLDGDPLTEVFQANGFNTDRAWYYTRNCLPQMLRNDGREHFGYIGSKPRSAKSEVSRDMGVSDDRILKSTGAE